MQEILDRFVDAMREAGCSPANPTDIIPDGRSRYTKLEGDRKDKRLGYRLTIESDGFAFGNFRNFKTSEHGKWNSSKGVSTLTAEERDAINQRIKEREARQTEEDKARHEEASKEARLAWEKATPATADHPYLIRKGIQPHGARVTDDGLLIIRGVSEGKTWTYQTIDADGGKLFLEGARKQGCYFPITDVTENKSVIIICEGFATGGSIREATGLPVVVAFDAGNLTPVAKEMRKNYPAAQIVIAGDNDAYGKRNTGEIAAQQAAVRVGGPSVVPQFDSAAGEPTDFNDLHKACGLDRVKDTILAVVSASGQGGVLPPESDSQPVLTEIIPAWEPDDLVPFNAPTTLANISPAFEDKKISSLVLWKKWPTSIADGKMEQNCLHNLLVFMRHKDKYRKLFRYDRFSGRILLYSKPFYWGHLKEGGNFKIRELCDTDVNYIKAEMEVDKLGPSDGNVYNAISTVAHENWINPPYDFFNALEWDGKPRLARWLKRYLGADGDEEYLSAVGTCWMIAGIARVMKPGSKAENMMVLEGPQGLKKSTALKTLASFGEDDDEETFFCDTLTFSRIQDKDTVLITKGKLIVEFAELANLGKREVEEVKTWMSIRYDEIRRPYGRNTEKFPRQFILAGSTNELQWLKDQTGNRRFWPVKCTRIDIAALKRDKDQLWAEAKYMYENKAQWWIEATNPLTAKIEAEQNLRLLGDIWKDPIEDFVSFRNFVTTNEVLEHFKIDIAHRGDKDYVRRVGQVLRSLGFESKVKYDQSEKTNVRGWERKKKIEEKTFIEEIDID